MRLAVAAAVCWLDSVAWCAWCVVLLCCRGAVVVLWCCGGCGAVVLCCGYGAVIVFLLLTSAAGVFIGLVIANFLGWFSTRTLLRIAREEEQLNQPSSYTTDYGNEGSPADDFLVTQSLVQAVDFRL